MCVFFILLNYHEALRICNKVKVHEHVRIEDLHSRCNIVSLEQCRRTRAGIWGGLESTELSHNITQEG